MRHVSSPIPVDRNKVRRFHQLLFAWYAEHRRHLPWRGTRDPYKILVSEVMLQQTQVSRVIPKYLAFIRRYPTPRALERAATADLLRVWSGLGYNRRAIYLKRAAGVIVNDWRGRWPTTVARLQALPGVGRYTAAAILSFAFGKDVPLADTNIRKVIGRIFVGPRWPTLTDQQLLSLVQRVIPRGRARVFPHALMDLGAALARRDPSLAVWRRAFPELFVPEVRPPKPTQRWEGSNRQLRGAILRLLQAGPVNIGGLSGRLGISKERLRILVASLQKDGLVAREGDRLTLPPS